MNFDQVQDILLSRGWIAAAALAGLIWRKHEARDEATASKVSQMATRDEVVRIHQRLDQQDDIVRRNHSEVMGHLLQMHGVPAPSRPRPPGAES